MIHHSFNIYGAKCVYVSVDLEFPMLVVQLSISMEQDPI